MPFTNFPYGVTSLGIPLPNSDKFPMNGGRHFWVHGNLGFDGYDGRNPGQPLLTMAQAFSLITSGDVIHVIGNIREQIATPVGVFDVTIIGESNSPRNADAHTGNNGYSGVTWKGPAAPAAATPLLIVKQQGWRFINILFNPPADAAAVQLFRDGGAGDLERDASHATFYGCRFDGGLQAIEQSGGCAFVRVYDCLFRGHTGPAFKDTAGAGIGTLLCWDICGCRFQDNKSHIVLALSGSVIRHCSIGKFNVGGGGFGIDLNNGPTDNMIFANALWGTYSIAGGYRKATAGDSWGGNYNVIAGGVTAAVPA